MRLVSTDGGATRPKAESWRRGVLAALLLALYWLVTVTAWASLTGEERPSLRGGVMAAVFFGLVIGLGPVAVRRARHRWRDRRGG